jgi:septum formation protein
VRTTTSPRLVLASASPARRRLLEAAGIDADVVVSGVDESAVQAVCAEKLCAVLARLKAEAVADRLRTDQPPTTNHQPTANHPPTANDPPAAGRPDQVLVLGCDSVLEFDGEIFGKALDAADAARRWRAMRGREGILHTGHCLIDVNGGRTAEAVAATTVRFATVTDEEIAAYVASGEPLQVAGAFTIDGLGGPFVERIDGDPGTVIGLSLPLLRHLLTELEVRVIDLWRPGTRQPAPVPRL